MSIRLYLINLFILHSKFVTDRVWVGAGAYRDAFINNNFCIGKE